MLSNALIQFSLDGQGSVPSLLLVEVMRIMGTSFRRSHACTAAVSGPPPAHASTGDSWTLVGKSGSVSCGVTAPFSWVLLCSRLCLCPPRVCFLNPV